MLAIFPTGSQGIVAISYALLCQVTSIFNTLPDTLMQLAHSLVESLVELPNSLVHLSHCPTKSPLLPSEHLEATPPTQTAHHRGLITEDHKAHQ